MRIKRQHRLNNQQFAASLNFGYNRAMVSLRQIRQFVAEIARQFEPQRIVLFGSYATGKFTVDSDVDLLVVMNCRGKTIEKEIQIRQAIHAPFPLDLPAEFQWATIF
jgi:predicted nucleotidyltransferase